jgi:type IV pilus assembly protein PilM
MKAKALIDLGASSTKMAIVDYGVVRQSHTINKGAQDITVDISRSLGISFVKAEEIKRRVGLIPTIGEDDLQKVVSPIVDYIFSEVNNVISNYQKKHSRAVDKIVLIGGGSMLKGLVDVARNNVDVPVVLGQPFDKVEVPAFLQEVLVEEGPSFATAIGLAMRAAQEL